VGGTSTYVLSGIVLWVLTREQAFPNRVAGVMETDDPEAAFRACVAALEGGICTIEVTMSVPSCLDIVRGLVASTGGELVVGVGMVWEAETVVQAREAGAVFVASPAVLPEVAAACAHEDILCMLGALTPTEIHEACRIGAGVVEVCPVQSVGGPDYIRRVMGTMPGVPLCVSGGVELHEVEEYLLHGVSVVGLTTALFPPEAVRRGDMGLITELARRATALTGALWA
jgi:2-dehydro-3-deoxyphosphogluconate aldolase/(4S)-4-hydroxy-2-oxoglutarate aldolase